MRRAGRTVSVLAALALLLSGCGGGDDGGHHDSGSSTTAATGSSRGGGTNDGGMTNSSAGGSSTTTSVDHGHDGMATSTTIFARAAATETVAISLVDFSFVDMPATVKGPRVLFRANNNGPSPHEMEIVDQNGAAVGVIKPFVKGQRRELAIELQPGTYTLRCLVKQGGETHAQLGMTSTFVVE